MNDGSAAARISRRGVGADEPLEHIIRQAIGRSQLRSDVEATLTPQHADLVGTSFCAPLKTHRDE